MGVVSFRLSSDEEERLAAAGIKPGPEAKAHMLRLLRGIEIDEDMAFFDRRRIASRQPTAELVRQDRER